MVYDIIYVTQHLYITFIPAVHAVTLKLTCCHYSHILSLSTYTGTHSNFVMALQTSLIEKPLFHLMLVREKVATHIGF